MHFLLQFRGSSRVVSILGINVKLKTIARSKQKVHTWMKFLLWISTWFFILNFFPRSFPQVLQDQPFSFGASSFCSNNLFFLQIWLLSFTSSTAFIVLLNRFLWSVVLRASILWGPSPETRVTSEKSGRCLKDLKDWRTLLWNSVEADQMQPSLNEYVMYLFSSWKALLSSFSIAIHCQTILD